DDDPDFRTVSATGLGRGRAPLLARSLDDLSAAPRSKLHRLKSFKRRAMTKPAGIGRNSRRPETGRKRGRRIKQLGGPRRGAGGSGRDRWLGDADGATAAADERFQAARGRSGDAGPLCAALSALSMLPAFDLMSLTELDLGVAVGFRPDVSAPAPITKDEMR